MTWTSKMTTVRTITNIVRNRQASFRFSTLTRLTLGIAEMEKQIEAMRGTISALKQHKKEKPQKKARQQPTPGASSSKPTKASASSKKGSTTKKSSKKSAAVPGDDDVLTFEQKKDLSEAIQTLDGQKLERVIQIIHEGVPEIRDVRPFLFSDLCWSLIRAHFSFAEYRGDRARD